MNFGAVCVWKVTCIAKKSLAMRSSKASKKSKTSIFDSFVDILLLMRSRVHETKTPLWQQAI